MSHAHSSYRLESSHQRRRGHTAINSLPGQGPNHSVFQSSSSPFARSVISTRKRETAPELGRARRSEDYLGEVPHSPTTSSPRASTSSSHKVRSIKDTRPSSSSSLTQEVLPLCVQRRHPLSNGNKPLPPPLPRPRADKPLPTPTSAYLSSFHAAQVKPTWTMPDVFDPRDYSIEPMSYWSDDSDDSDTEDGKKSHRRGSSKLSGMWRRSRNSKTMKSTNTSNPQFQDELTNNLAKLQ